MFRIVIKLIIQSVFLPITLPLWVWARILYFIKGINTLTIEIPANMPDEGEASGLARYLISSDSFPFSYFITLLSRAVEDQSIKNVIITVPALNMGWSRVYEIARVLNRLRESGKRIFIYLEQSGNLEYYLASHADYIGAFPASSFMLQEFAVESLHLRGLLDQYEITAEFLAAGKYKSAAERLTRKKLSAPARQAMQQLVDSLQHTWINTVAEQRHIGRPKAASLLKQGPWDAEELQHKKHVDFTGFEEEFDDFILEKSGLKELKKRDLAEFSQRLARKNRSLFRLKSRPTIVLLNLSGAIYDGLKAEDSKDGVNGRQTAETLRQIREAKEARAILIRVNSPGGSAQASEKIHHELMLCREAGIPVTVSFSDVAASGGYYIAMAGEHIMSSPLCITGSIGVLMGKITLRGLMNRYGITKDRVSAGSNSALFSEYSPMSPALKKKLGTYLNIMYSQFKQRVIDGRGLDAAQVESLAQGRVWAGKDALESGLVDSEGGLIDSIYYLKEKIGLKPSDRVNLVLEPRKSVRHVLNNLKQKLRPGFNLHESLLNPNLPGETHLLNQYQSDRSAAVYESGVDYHSFII